MLSDLGARRHDGWRARPPTTTTRKAAAMSGQAISMQGVTERFGALVALGAMDLERFQLVDRIDLA